jgi:hypothetical protein
VKGESFDLIVTAQVELDGEVRSVEAPEGRVGKIRRWYDLLYAANYLRALAKHARLEIVGNVIDVPSGIRNVLYENIPAHKSSQSSNQPHGTDNREQQRADEISDANYCRTRFQDRQLGLGGMNCDANTVAWQVLRSRTSCFPKRERGEAQASTYSLTAADVVAIDEGRSPRSGRLAGMFGIIG